MRRRSALAAAAVTGAALTALGTAAAPAGGIATRFGALGVGGAMGTVLSFRGRVLVRGGNPLRPAGRFRMGSRDVVLVREEGGTACPALYYFVTVSASGARATRAFGTCDELTGVTRRGARLLVSMPGYRGPFEPAAARARAARETHVFTYRDGVVTERGRRVR